MMDSSESGVVKRKSSILISFFTVLFGLSATHLPGQDEPCAGKVRTTPIGGSYYATGTAVNQNLLVTVGYDSVTTWDLSDPDSPERLGQWVSAAEFRSYAEHDRLEIDSRGFAYVGNWDPYSVEIFDLRDPLHPKPISYVWRSWNDFLLFDNLLIGTRWMLDIIDVSDPFHPVVICDGCRDLSGNGPPSWGNNPVLAMAGDHLTTLDFEMFRVFDISDPSNPTEVASLEMDGFHHFDAQMWAGKDLVVIWSLMGMDVIDMSDPTQPVAFALDYHIYLAPYWGSVCGRTFFVDQGGSVGVLDLTDPAQPEETDQLDYNTRSGEIHEDKLYLSVYSGIEVLDLSAHPYEVVGGADGDLVSEIVTDGDLGIVRGLKVVRLLALDAPGGPREIDRLKLGGIAGHAAIDGTTVAVLDYPQGVALLSVDGGFHLEKHTLIETGECQAGDIDLMGDVLAIPLLCQDDSGAIEVYDVSDLTHPELLARYETDEPVLATVVDGERMFATSGGNLLEFDISDPGALPPPVTLLISEDANRLYSLAHAGECLFVGTAGSQYGVVENLLAAVDITHPGGPSLLSVTDDGTFWLAGSEGLVAGGEYWELNLARCPVAGEELEVKSFTFPRSVTRRGSIQDGTLYLAAHHSIDELDLGCVQPEADFRWYQMGTAVQFEDRTTYDAWSYVNDREWKWKFSNGRTAVGRMAPFIDFKLPGVYTATLEVTTEMGTSTVTKTIELPRQPGLSPENRQSGGRVVP